jgi:macrolide transport system ATP-binding/permease protein
MPAQNLVPENPLIRLEKVCRVFMQGDQRLEVLKDISLGIEPGEFVAIVGQSGSGKTTLMNILGCLDRPSSGRYLVKGRDMALLPPDELSTLRREVFGFVFQRYNLLPGSNARENVEMPAVYSNMPGEERKARAAGLLGRLRLEDRLGHLPAQLSGGQQQRVSIARALMNGGEVILADEPTGALDSASGQEVLDLLSELHAAGHTIILITHDQSVAARARRIITLSDGRVVSDEKTGKTVESAGKSPVLEARPGGGRISCLPLHISLFMALRSLKDNRFRTMLTLLGIIIGVASVVAMLALGNGAKAKVLASIESMGSDLITIRSMGGSSRSGAVRIVDADVAALAGLPGVWAVVGEMGGSATVRYHESDYSTSYTATGVDKPVVGNWALARGEFFNDGDAASSAPVAVLGQTVVSNIFPPGLDPVGKYVLIQNVPFLVVGVMQKKGANSFGRDEDDVILLPVNTARLRLMGQKYLNNAIIKAAPGQDMDELQANIQKLMIERHNSEDFRVFNTASVLEAVNESQDALTMLLGSVAAISLLVGGIGVMNIMLVSVVERTREIGVRMACGARQRDIMRQFITEALVVCCIGGLLGVGLGLLASFAAQYKGTAVMYSLPPVLLAFSSALATGLIFGWAPARKAARLDPVDALASE